jgi:CheY-like chemotaxis protein
MPPTELRVLVVEDYEDTRDAICFYLAALGCFVEGVRTVAESLNKLETATWDMLLTDISLPDGTGWDIREEVACPFFTVSMSSHVRPAVRSKSLRIGFHRHLDKPIEPSDLDEAIAAARQWKHP